MADETNQETGADKPVSKPSSKSSSKASMEERVTKVVEDWKAAKLRNTAFSRNTGAWNALSSALPDLIAKIVEEVS